MEIYRVGGAVRDRLLGQEVKEKDYVVVGATPEELLKQGFKPVGKDFPVFLHPITHEEYALARTERKEGPGYTGFSVYAAKEVSLEEDLKRRDLTINAIAETNEGDIIDPYDGCRDIEQKILRHVSPAFIEDPVRILRVARFMARFASFGFQIAPETFLLIKQMVDNGEVDALVPERIWREFKKALAEPSPNEFVMTLVRCGAWLRICPEWTDVSAERSAQALESLKIATQLISDTKVRFVSVMKFIAADSEDIGAARSLSQRWRLPAVYRDLLILSIRYRKKTQQAKQMNAEEILDLLEHIDALRRPERFRQFLTVCEIDWRSKDAWQGESYIQKEILLSAANAIESISVVPLVAAELKGEAFSQQLRKLRIQALFSLLNQA